MLRHGKNGETHRISHQARLLNNGPGKDNQGSPERNCRLLTIKGLSVGASRLEYEYEIPGNEANELLDNFSISELSKIRYNIVYKNKTWEVDEFLSDNAGLLIAEIELEQEDEYFECPDWVGKEVTEDAKYYNSNLAIDPYKNWVRETM
ncbi:CYTH domain-containing protein [Paraflavitalea speifideaquila]|uniref:CYTH domain-containing protein n=1 Tax=Paraflavitalea speifideaquila TaxID=3076558 RepID=UPI0028E5F2A9|nr:CYTH domain-containing protein [Paraflavitalea speifideiaquila]